MKDAIKTFDNLPWIVKLLLVIFGDIYGVLVRIARGDVAGIVIGVLQIVTGNFFGIAWIIDLITVIVKKEVTVLA